jgi:hypothetical protein
MILPPLASGAFGIASALIAAKLAANSERRRFERETKIRLEGGAAHAPRQVPQAPQIAAARGVALVEAMNDVAKKGVKLRNIRTWLAG